MTWDATTPAGDEAAANGDNRIRELKTDLVTALRGNTTDGLEAKFPGSDTASPVFRYRGLKGLNAARPASGQYGLYTNTDKSTLQRDNGSTWESIATLIPAGTVMVFFQAAAPTGWTKLTTQNDKALRVVSGASGGSAGGTTGLSTGIAHSIATHTHTITADTGHTHTVASHTHTIPSHSHVLQNSGVDKTPITASGTVVEASSVAGNTLSTGPTRGGIGAVKTEVTNATDSISGVSTGAATPATDSQGSHSHGAVTGASGTLATDTITLAYIDVIICSKDAD